MLKISSIDGVEPVSLQEAEDQCYIIDGDTTTQLLLDSFIKAARTYAENRTWRSFVDSTWIWKMDCFPIGILEVPKPPLISVDSIAYIDGDGVSQALVEDTDYRVDAHSEPGRIEPINNWPGVNDQVNAVTITFKAGYTDSGSVSQVPEDVKIALRMLVKTMYDNRDSHVLPDRASSEYIPVPIGTDALLDAYSVRTP